MKFCYKNNLDYSKNSLYCDSSSRGMTSLLLPGVVGWPIWESRSLIGRLLEINTTDDHLFFFALVRTCWTSLWSPMALFSVRGLGGADPFVTWAPLCGSSSHMLVFTPHFRGNHPRSRLPEKTKFWNTLLPRYNTLLHIARIPSY